MKGFFFERWFLGGIFLILLVISCMSIRPLRAADLSNKKVTISDSRAGKVSVTYDFSFDASSTAIKQWTVQFCTTASGTCATPSGMNTTGATRATDAVSGTGRTDDMSANGTLKTIVTTPAAQSGTITASYTGITNPSTVNTTSYAIVTTYSDLGSTVIDTGLFTFAVLDTQSILVTADVGATFSFTVAPVTSGSVNSQSITISGATASSIPFGTLSSGTSKVAAHDATITTNASHGYSLTVRAVTDPPLQDGGNDIDPFTGTNSTPTTWTAPAGLSVNTNTGFFGYTTESTSLCSGAAGRFSSNKWAGTETTPREIACSTSSVLAGDTTRIGWQAEVNAIQPPGSYTGSVILVATPTY